MEKLFKRAAVFSDIHFGKKGDSEIHNKDCLDFIEWFCNLADERKCDTILFLGDWSDNQTRLRLDTNYYSRQAIDRLIETKAKRIYWLLGNHDTFHKESRDVHSLPFLVNYSKKITLINEVTEIGNTLLCPWLVGTEHFDVPEFEVKYVFGHFELPLFLMNEQVECFDKGKLHMNHFYQCEAVFSGHFHRRQVKLNEHNIPITYIGNPFAHNYNDIDDRDRGCMILEWDKEPEFINWEIGPRYLSLPLSAMVEHIENDSIGELINDRSVVKCSDDLNIDLEEYIEVKELLQDYMRDVIIEPSIRTINAEDETEIDEDIPAMSVDQLVIEHLRNLDTEGSDFDSSILIDMYNRTDE